MGGERDLRGRGIGLPLVACMQLVSNPGHNACVRPCTDSPPRRSQVAFDALAAGMLVTILLDTWRISFGGIVDNEKTRAGLTFAA